jgi:hypothetical protein
MVPSLILHVDLAHDGLAKRELYRRHRYGLALLNCKLQGADDVVYGHLKRSHECSTRGMPGSSVR